MYNYDINKLLFDSPNESNYLNYETNPFTNENEEDFFINNFNSRYNNPFLPANINSINMMDDVSDYGLCSQNSNININNNDQNGTLSAINEVQNNHNGTLSTINEVQNNHNGTLSATNEVQNNHNIKNEVKIKIFEIKKVNKNIGRKRKNDSRINLNNDKIHTKNDDDNIRTKILRQLYKHSLKYSNDSFKSSENLVIKKQELFKINTSFIIFSEKEKNLNLLGTKLKFILSYELSKRFKNKDNNHNKETIDIILHQNDENINYFLNLNMEDILDIYAGKNEDEIIKNFPTIDDDIANFK